MYRLLFGDGLELSLAQSIGDGTLTGLPTGEQTLVKVLHKLRSGAVGHFPEGENQVGHTGIHEGSSQAENFTALGDNVHSRLTGGKDKQASLAGAQCIPFQNGGSRKNAAVG